MRLRRVEVPSFDILESITLSSSEPHWMHRMIRSLFVLCELLNEYFLVENDQLGKSKNYCE